NKEEFSREYGVLQIRLGFSYLTLQTARRDEDLQSATEHFNEAIKICGEKGIAKEYHAAKIGLALALIELPVEDRVSNLREAVHILSEEAKFFTKEDSPRAYVIANNGLGFAHEHLYNFAGQKKEDASASEAYFKEVLSITDYGRFPVEYAKAQLGLGTLYASLPGTDEEGLEDKSLHALWDARNIFSEEFFPTYYTNDLFLTSLVYIEKGDYEKAEEFIQKTIEVAGRTNDPLLPRYMSYLYAFQARQELEEY
ncbi:MAG: hypothetical protein ACE5KK_07955, partial [Candidatus Brocadiales bacterium]